MALNLHLLRIFTTVVEQHSFSRAATVLYISQPAVSKSVQELENQLGVILIDRSQRRLMLTEAGRILFEHAQRLFAVERAAEAALEQLHGLERGRLSIGASQTIGTYLLPPLLGLFHQRYPGVQLSLEIENTQRVIDDLRTKPLDLAFVEGPVSDPDLVVTTWRTDRLVVIAPPDHPLSAQRVSLEQVTHYPYVQRESGSGTRNIVEQALYQRALKLNVALELGSNQAVKQAVIAGLGISIVSEATLDLEQNAGILAVIEPYDFYLSRPLSQVTIQGRPESRALAAFRDLFLQS
jgi:DNA-binding transcriptional LysR family regulator